MANQRKSRQSWKQNSKKTIHNQHKPFNPGRYGKVWGNTRFEHDWDRVPQGDANGPVIGKLCVGNTEVELTFSETNKIIEVLHDAQVRFNVGTRLGQTNSHAGTKSFY